MTESVKLFEEAMPHERPTCCSSSPEFPERRRHSQYTGTEALKLHEQVIPPSARPYPVSSRAYNRKDYDYILSFPHVRHAGLMARINQSPQEISAEACGRDADITDTFSQSSKTANYCARTFLQPKHVGLPEFGSWNLEVSSTVEGEGYTDVFDHARDQRKGRSIPSQLLPHQSQSSAKEEVKPQIQSHATTHHRKCSSLALRPTVSCTKVQAKTLKKPCIRGLIYSREVY